MTKENHMGLDRLIQAVAALAVLASLTGHLPQMIAYARKAQFQIIQDSKASKWPKAFLLPVK